IDTMVKDMRAQLSTLTPLPGKKAFLFISGGLEQQPGWSMFQYAAGGAVGVGAIPPVDTRRVDIEIANLAKLANADEITFYTIDAKGLNGPGGTAANDDPLAFRPGVAFFAQQNAQSGLLTLAQETGGIAMVNSNDFDRGFGRVYQDASTYYSVGVNLSSLSGVGYQNVQVTVNRPGLSVRYRRGYASRTNDDRYRDVTRAALKTSVAYNAFPVKIQVGPSTKAKKQYEQPVTVLVPASALTFVPEGDSAKATAEIYVGVADDKGRTSDIGKEVATFTQPRDAAADAALAYPITLQMRKGNARIVVNVRDLASGKMGTARADVHVE
ncbi:MAG TPA: VWA domain-containing protein, partial [Thermoanaerobaculia bacterium]